MGRPSFKHKINMSKISGILILVLIVLLSSCEKKIVAPQTEIAEVVLPVMQYGFDLNEFDIVEDTVKSGDTFGDIIDPHLTEDQSVFEAAQEFEEVYDVRRIQVGKPYKILKRKDSLGTTRAFIYEPTKMDYTFYKRQRICRNRKYRSSRF